MNNNNNSSQTLSAKTSATTPKLSLEILEKAAIQLIEKCVKRDFWPKISPQ
jgi:hypothetical protein